MESKKYREPVEFDLIQAAIQGDADSINQIIAYFQPYINARCRRKFVDSLSPEVSLSETVSSPQSSQSSPIIKYLSLVPLLQCPNRHSFISNAHNFAT